MQPHFAVTTSSATTLRPCRCRPRGRILRSLPLALALLTLAAHAQQPLAQPEQLAPPELLASNTPANAFLPNSPGFNTTLSFQTEPQTTATLTGVVLDIREAMVANAHITLETPTGTVLQTETSDNAGTFLFKDIPAGQYRVRITSPGLEGYLSHEVTLHPGEKHELPRIALPIAPNTSDVNVIATQDQIATEQVHQELHQRAFGVFPNFYTSYIWNAAPLTTKLKFELAFRSTTDPINFISPAIVAGIQQARGTYAGYGDGIEGYAKRYGADYGNVVIGRFIGAAILPTLFRQDPRYFYQGSGTVTARTRHAVASTFIARGDNGRTQPNYSYLLGISAAAAITNLYYPDNDRTAGTIVANVFLRIGVHSVGNVVREFISRRVTTAIPDYATGKEESPAKTTP